MKTAIFLQVPEKINGNICSLGEMKPAVCRRHVDIINFQFLGNPKQRKLSNIKSV